MKYIEGYDRKQVVLFPQCIDELIPHAAEVRIIDVFVDSLPLEELGFMHHDPVEEGRPMYHPRDLFKLYVYGYLNRIRTSRLLERECQRNVELMWLLKGLRPCFRTIAGFRSEHPEMFRNAFRYFVAGLNKGAFLGRKVVAIDSSKFRAVNSKKNNFNQRKIDRQLAYIDEKIAQYVDELDQGDLSEAQQIKTQQKLTRNRKQKRKYKRIEKQLHESGEVQVSTTDPDARSMILHGSVIEVAYNVQTVVDDKHNLIVEYQPTNTNDRKALLPMSVKAKEACGVTSITAIADKGYHNALANQLGVTEEERKELLPSGAAPVFYNRTAWAKTYLKKAGLLDSPKQGIVIITERGLEVLKKNPISIDVKFLKQFSEFQSLLSFKRQSVKTKMSVWTLMRIFTMRLQRKHSKQLIRR